MARWSSWFRRVGGCVAVTLVLWTCSGLAVISAAAQNVTATTGAVNGTVTDSTKAVVPGVIVTLAGPSLVINWTATSDDTGEYHFSAVPPGDYALRFELPCFATIVRDGIRVGIGFTATVNAELRPGDLIDSVTVSGAPVIDLTSTEVTARFDSDTLATLPGARDIFAVLANTPGIAMTRVDVGGNAALSMQEYSSYGLRATTGMNRNEVEGIRVGGATGANDNYYSDFGAFAEIAVNAVGHSAAVPVPGTMARYVSKSGGNRYHGSAYADFQTDAWEATNIDSRQIARGLAGGPGLDVRRVNHLQRFRDITADVGGYLKKDVAWWYGAYRDTEVQQRYPWLLDSPARLTARIATGKLSYQLSPRQIFVGYVQHQEFTHSNSFIVGANQPFQLSDALPRMTFPATVWKGEYNAALTNVLYVEARLGGYFSKATNEFKSTAPRISDVGANTVTGGALANQRSLRRPQMNGSVSFLKSGWGGSHTVRVGGEYMLDSVEWPTFGYGNSCNCVSILNNDAPSQVQILVGPNVSKNDMVTSAVFVDDTWRVNRRVTLSLGLRLDRYQPGLPEQEGPAGEAYGAIDSIVTFNNWGPRLGMSADLTGDGKTVMKVHYGRFWLYPGTNFTGAFNPNPTGWTRTHLWTNDQNGNGRWDPGEEGSVTSVSGGSTSTRLDPDIVNTHVHQTIVFIEHEVAREMAVRTGVVMNARRHPYGTINIRRPLRVYTLPVPVIDPGPDGRPGSADDGGLMTAYGVSPEALAVPPVNVTMNLPDSDSEYYTWEMTASRRPAAWGSLFASFTHTWHREAALGAGSDFTPTALVNATGNQLRFTTWQAKLHGTVTLPADFRLVPVIRSQSGTPYARTFVSTLNYGNATIKAEPISANRTPTITLVDLRTEKTFHVTGAARVMAFFDVYNLFNTNAEQMVTTSSGASWLRPISITGPRILRIGARLEW
jgi:hypothetical protein